MAFEKPHRREPDQRQNGVNGRAERQKAGKTLAGALPGKRLNFWPPALSQMARSRVQTVGVVVFAMVNIVLLLCTLKRRCLRQ